MTKMMCVQFQKSISENSLVAMDFSGQKSRVIENPSEALSVAVEEGLSWRVSYTNKPLLYLRGNSYKNTKYTGC